MTRAGKEPAEDAKRAFVRAIELAGLKVHQVQMFAGRGAPGRFVVGTAKPDGWAHQTPALEMHTFVEFTGEISPVEIRCAATDEDPLMSVFRVPVLRHCSCELDRLPETLRAVWEERQVVVSRARRGPQDARFIGRWVWETPVEPDIRA